MCTVCRAGSRPLRDKKETNKDVKLLALNWITAEPQMTTHPLAKKGYESLSVPHRQLADVRRMKQKPQMPSSLSGTISASVFWVGRMGVDRSELVLPQGSTSHCQGKDGVRANRKEFKFGTRPHLIYFNWLSCDCPSVYNLTVFSWYEKCFCAGWDPGSSQFLYRKKGFLSFHCSAE